MSSLDTTQTKLELIKDERIRTQDRIRALKEELYKLESEEIQKDINKDNLELFIDTISEEKVKEFLLSLFNSDDYTNSYEYSKVIKHLDTHELLLASISNEKKYFGAFVIAYCLIGLNMQCKDISKRFSKSRSWATYKAIEILTIRLKKYIDINYYSHILHYKEMYSISAYSNNSNAIALSS